MRYLLAGFLILSTCWAQDVETRDLDLPVHPSFKLPPRPTPAVTSPNIPSVIPPAPPTFVPIETHVVPTDDPVDEPPPVFFGEEIDTETASLIYVIDISGSMGEWLVSPKVEWVPSSPGSVQGSLRAVFGTGVSRMDIARRELSRSIDGLSPNFQFTVIAYDCRIIFWSTVLLTATAPNKAQAQGWVSQLQPGGYTGTAGAVVSALSYIENSCVVLLTDGAPYECPRFMLPDAHRDAINTYNKCKRPNPAVINVFGIAAGFEMRRFCQDVANDSGGSYYDVLGSPPPIH